MSPPEFGDTPWYLLPLISTGRGLYFEPNFQENGQESAKTVGNGIVQHEILCHFSFDTIGKKPFFNFFFEKNRKSPHE